MLIKDLLAYEIMNNSKYRHGKKENKLITRLQGIIDSTNKRGECNGNREKV